MIKRMLVATFILFAMLLFLLPRTDDVSKKKMSSAAMLMCSKEFRKAVAAQVLHDEPITLQFNNNCPELIAAIDVAEDGTLTLHGAQHGVLMTLTPMVEFGDVRWSCRGEPPQTTTALCKP